MHARQEDSSACCRRLHPALETTALILGLLASLRQRSRLLPMREPRIGSQNATRYPAGAMLLLAYIIGFGSGLCVSFFNPTSLPESLSSLPSSSSCTQQQQQTMVSICEQAMIKIYNNNTTTKDNQFRTITSSTNTNRFQGVVVHQHNNNYNNDDDNTVVVSSVDGIVNGISQTDLRALTFHDTDGESLLQQIKQEQKDGLRDKFFLPNTYNARLNNDHFDDTQFKDEWQKEVYLMAQIIMRKLVPPPAPRKDGNNTRPQERRGLVADIGAGSGYKLVHYLSPEFRTIGFETEPAISFLRKTYPDQEWVDSGEPEKSLPQEQWRDHGKSFDLCICSDVMEHIADPDDLMQFLISLDCTLYVISTPKRDDIHLSQGGPPGNRHHVREWNFHELQAYLSSQGFRVVRALDGIQHHSTQFVVAVKAQR